MYQLDEPIYFYILFSIPFIWSIFFFLSLWKKKTQKQFISSNMLEKLSPERSNFKGFLKLIIMSLGIISISFGLVNPKIGTKLETVKREGVDIVFAIDVSKSMLTEDIAPNRIEKAKRLVSALLNQLVSDRVGIIVYAASAVPQLPITTDYGATKMFLQSINTDIISSQGTAIDDAIKLGIDFFDEEIQTNRILFILSDGEDHAAENTINVAQLANAKGIKIFSIGVGTEKGGLIPIKSNGIVESYKKDENGEVVISKRSDIILTSISESTDGVYIDGNDTNYVINKVKDELQKIEKKEFEAKKFVSYKDRFQIFLILGFILIFIDQIILETKTKWVARLNLFNEN